MQTVLVSEETVTELVDRTTQISKLSLALRILADQETGDFDALAVAVSIVNAIDEEIDALGRRYGDIAAARAAAA